MNRVRKDGSGFTLVELLAVVVILAIIAGIAIPSIGAIIDNTKKDAHVANARMAISAAKLAVASDPEYQPTGTKAKTLTIKLLEDEGYLETLQDPDGADYEREPNTLDVNIEAPGLASYVKVEQDGNQFRYSVYLNGSKREVKNGDSPLPVPERNLSRDVVIDK